jgi:hypothetical protein
MQRRQKMNIKSKLIIITAVLAILLQSQVFAAAGFTDIDDSPAKDMIISLQERGIVKGIGNNLFAPKDKVTAAQTIQLFVNAFDLNLDNVRFIKEPKATDYFINADNEAWYAEAFIIASVKGLNFPSDLDPNKKMSREEFTYYLVMSMETQYNLPMIKLIPADIADEKDITTEYSGAIQRSLVYGITSLDADGKFNPKEEITREEAASQVFKALEYIKAHTSTN